MMKKRLSFKCWNCTRIYSLFKEISDEQKLIIACPFCNQEAVVDLNPFRTEKKTVVRGPENEDQAAGYEYNFPNPIPTQKPD